MKNMWLAVPVVVVAAVASARVGWGDASPSRAQMSDLAFMAGCWEGAVDAEGNRIVEHYTTPLSNVMLGTTRYVAGDSATSFELSAIVRRGGGIVLMPFPNGVRSEHDFTLTRAGRGEAVFEAPEHDFPKRVVYRSLAAGELVARIDGGEGSSESSSWTMKAIPCGGAAPDAR